MTRIKLCGLSRPADIDAANALGPDYVGFIFAKKSRRYVSPEDAAALRRQLSASIRTVGVFVNAPPEFVADLLDRGVIDLIQLHGQEDGAYIDRLRALADRPIIQAFRVAEKTDLGRARRSAADYVLLDNGAGGTGEAFDWQLAAGLERPWFLAGGLSPENAAAAVRALRPWAVDVSSGIETNGLKDPGKMRAFVEAVRQSDEGRS